MTRKYGWILGLSLLGAGQAWGQESPKRSEVPKTEPAPVMAAPAPEAPVVPEAFVISAPTRPSFTLSADYLQWWFKGGDLPPLLTTGNERNPDGSVNAISAGTLDDPNVVVLFRGNGLSYNTISGIRLDAGFALNDERTIAIEANGFLLGKQSINDRFSGVNGTPFLTRPFYNQHDVVEAGYDVSSAAVPGVVRNYPALSGTIDFHADINFYGYEANIAFSPTMGKGKLAKILFGARYLSLTENLAVTEVVGQTLNRTTPSAIGYFGTPLAGGQQALIVDQFGSRNDFYGPQLGMVFRWEHGPLTLDFMPKVAVGVNQERVNVGGSTSVVTNGVVTQTGSGGLLAVSTNSGNFSRDELTVVPELGLKLQFELTSCLRMSVGYNVIYLSSVVRPGDQIDRRLNPQFVPSDLAYNPNGTPPFPTATFKDTDFWAHGMNFGLELRY